jgi:hypothetical protein
VSAVDVIEWRWIYRDVIGQGFRSRDEAKRNLADAFGLDLAFADRFTYPIILPVYAYSDDEAESA